MTNNNQQTDQASINHAIHILQQGGIIAYPTEAVFGLGCLANKPQSIEKLLKLKQRPIDKGLILLAAEFSQFKDYIELLDDSVLHKIQSSWPGPTTWVVPARPETSPLIRGKFNSIAIRISAHPIVQALCRQCQSPIISTSANMSGQNMTYNTAQVRLQFKEQLDYILEGALGDSHKPSIIKDAISNKIIRS